MIVIAAVAEVAVDDTSEPDTTDEEAGIDAGGVGVRLCVGGSTGVSGFAASWSECSPIGFRGNLSVPLFATGWMPRESQTML